MTQHCREENCPARDEFAAAAAGLSCVRRCGQDRDCNNERKLCLCDGLCGLSCIRAERECGEQADPQHGQVVVAGRNYQDTASFTCNQGYTLVGLSQLSCQASGRWSGEPHLKLKFTEQSHLNYCSTYRPEIKKGFSAI